MAEISDSVGEFLAIFWRFFCGRGPKSCHALAGDPCLVALGVFLPGPFVAINPFGKLPKITLNNSKLREVTRSNLREIALDHSAENPGIQKILRNPMAKKA